MAKTKTPFFSLGAQGSVGGSITAQKRGQNTLVRSKPLPSDPYSLPQAYRRWLYTDYAHLWLSQSLATRRSYQSLGARYHLTGFQYYMSVMLKTLPDILVWSKLDEKSGTIAKDSGKQGNNGVITGASPSALGINGAYLFDGINDKVEIPQNAELNALSDFTIEFLFYSIDLASQNIVCGSRDSSAQAHGWHFITAITTGIGTFIFDTGAGVTGLSFTPNLCDGKIHHLCVTRHNSTFLYYLDGALSGTSNLAGIINGSEGTMLGRTPRNTPYFDGRLDNFLVYNRALDPITVLRHSARRYSPLAPPPYVPPVGIDIGSPAIDRPDERGGYYTIIDSNNPANGNGTLDTIEVWALNNISNFRVGTFYVTGANKLKCREAILIGNVTAGSKQTFSGLSIAVQTGDFIGCYFWLGNLETTAGVGAPFYWIAGNYCTTGAETTYGVAQAELSLYGIGS